jgi:hypothetical protein
MMLQPKTVVMRAGKSFEAFVADGLMLCDLETGNLLSLNVTARAIWEAIAAPVTIAAISEALQRRFAVSEDECLRDLTTALAEFERRGFVQIALAAELSPSARAANDVDALSL